MKEGGVLWMRVSGVKVQTSYEGDVVPSGGSVSTTPFWKPNACPDVDVQLFVSHAYFGRNITFAFEQRIFPKLLPRHRQPFCSLPLSKHWHPA